MILAVPALMTSMCQRTLWPSIVVVTAAQFLPFLLQLAKVLAEPLSGSSAVLHTISGCCRQMVEGAGCCCSLCCVACQALASQSTVSQAH